jgi:hypothetical protein
MQCIAEIESDQALVGGRTGVGNIALGGVSALFAGKALTAEIAEEFRAKVISLLIADFASPLATANASGGCGFQERVIGTR